MLSVESVASIARRHLAGYVNVSVYDYSPCYLWYDSPVYNPFGELECTLDGDTIYLSHHSPHPQFDLFHELGHTVARKLNVVGHRENGYRGSWDRHARRLMGSVASQRHWSGYLNQFARQHCHFKFHAAGELWAELFMLWFMAPHTDVRFYIDREMTKLRSQPVIQAADRLAGVFSRA